ncbi:MAG: portal protein, partial [Mycobacterium sp.]
MAVPMLVAAEATYELRRHCEKRKLELDEARRPWLEHCRSVATELFPHKLPYIEDPGSTAAKGQERNQHITDAVGHLALTTVAAGIHQGMMPSSSPWFGLRIRGLTTPEWPVAGFLEQSVHALREMHNQSNANHVLPESQQEWAGFGTAAALVIEDDEDDFRLDGMSVGEYWIADDARGRVDTLYREISMTIGQLIEMFGEENLSPSAESEARQHRWDTRVTVVHAIEPDRDGL